MLGLKELPGIVLVEGVIVTHVFRLGIDQRFSYLLMDTAFHLHLSQLQNHIILQSL